MGDWIGHGSCNKFTAESGADTARGALERYLHCYHRYSTHEQSKKFETQLREAAVMKMVEMQASFSIIRN
jgi:hypothetical protein